MNVLQELRDDATGLQLVRDWLGDGGETVEQAHADERAAICAGCRQNSPVNYGQLKLAVAALIKRGIEIKRHVNLSTPHDDALHVCKVCRCVLATKVWVPVKHIRAHTTDKQLAELPDHCWMRREILFHLLPP